MANYNKQVCPPALLLVCLPALAEGGWGKKDQRKKDRGRRIGVSICTDIGLWVSNSQCRQCALLGEERIGCIPGALFSRPLQARRWRPSSE